MILFKTSRWKFLRISSRFTLDVIVLKPPRHQEGLALTNYNLQHQEMSSKTPIEWPVHKTVNHEHPNPFSHSQNNQYKIYKKKKSIEKTPVHIISNEYKMLCYLNIT